MAFRSNGDGSRLQEQVYHMSLESPTSCLPFPFTLGTEPGMFLLSLHFQVLFMITFHLPHGGHIGII